MKERSDLSPFFDILFHFLVRLSNDFSNTHTQCNLFPSIIKNFTKIFNINPFFKSETSYQVGSLEKKRTMRVRNGRRVARNKHKAKLKAKIIYHFISLKLFYIELVLSCIFNKV